ncbi:replication factor C large subunit [Candidatus Micrarchaeota archaeon]|nr:replication factor C large subunit [Candidatus Micrarchaeota archaeon]
MEKASIWTVKHAPASVAQCVGNDDARAAMQAWAKGWAGGKKQKPLLLYGPPGVGKSACAYALAGDMGWELVESNASDLRDKETLRRIFELSSTSAGLYGAKRLLVFDEIDSAMDRGGVPEIGKIVAEASQPVILIANDAWNPKLAPLWPACAMLEFKSINTPALRSALEMIAQKEGISTEQAQQLASGAKGDLRSAINDLQAGFASERERKSASMFRVVGKILKAATVQDAVRAGDESGADLDFLSRWVEQNIPAEYEKPDELARAFESLALAALFSARIRKRQNYSLLKYVRALTLGGVAVGKDAAYSKFSKYQFPTLMSLLSSSRAKRELAKSAFLKAGAHLHCSSRDAKDALLMVLPIPGAAEHFSITEGEAEAAAAVLGIKLAAGKETKAGKTGKNDGGYAEKTTDGNDGRTVADDGENQEKNGEKNSKNKKPASKERASRPEAKSSPNIIVKTLADSFG